MNHPQEAAALMTTEMVQECVENDAAEAYKELLIESHPYGEVRISEAVLDQVRAIGAKEFNRWLAEHDREVKAQAWQEGYRTSCQDHGGYTSCGTGDDPHSASRTNPYKEEA